MSAAKLGKPGRAREQNGNWKGGVGIYRDIAAEARGRPLEEDEVVHHIDGDRTNNDPKNLDIRESQGDHLKLHAQLRKTKDF